MTKEQLTNEIADDFEKKLRAANITPKQLVVFTVVIQKRLQDSIHLLTEVMGDELAYEILQLYIDAGKKMTAFVKENKAKDNPNVN